MTLVDIKKDDKRLFVNEVGKNDTETISQLVNTRRREMYPDDFIRELVFSEKIRTDNLKNTKNNRWEVISPNENNFLSIRWDRIEIGTNDDGIIVVVSYYKNFRWTYDFDKDSAAMDAIWDPLRNWNRAHEWTNSKRVDMQTDDPTVPIFGYRIATVTVNLSKDDRFGNCFMQPDTRPNRRNYEMVVQFESMNK